MRILLVSNRANPAAVDAAYKLIAYFTTQDIGYDMLDVTDLPDATFPYSFERHPELAKLLNNHYDMAITLGGDGTLLHTARLSTPLRTKLLGLNFGHLGFLTNHVEDDLIELVTDALAGEIACESRVNLHVDVVCEGDSDADDYVFPTYRARVSMHGDSPHLDASDECDGCPRTFFAMNEVAIMRGALGHIVDFSFGISGDHVARMRGDGIMVATATGSTAYALSAGGPLVGPDYRGMIVVPVAPHTLNSRAVMTGHNDVVEVVFAPDSASSKEVSIFADGDVLSFKRPVRAVVVKVGENPTLLLNRRTGNFYRQISKTFFYDA